MAWHGSHEWQLTPSKLSPNQSFLQNQRGHLTQILMNLIVNARDALSKRRSGSAGH